MSNHIYITRHGESQWNIEGKVQGVTDTPLTAKGIEQAHELAKKIKESGLKIDEILYSPLSRATDTAKIVAEENGLPLTLEPRLIEQNFGEYEGHEWKKHPGVFHEAKKQFACDYNGGESMLRLAQPAIIMAASPCCVLPRESIICLMNLRLGARQKIKLSSLSHMAELPE